MCVCQNSRNCYEEKLCLGHEIIGEEPDIMLLPSCGCYFPCRNPVNHFMIPYSSKIFEVIRRAQVVANDKLVTIAIYTAR